MTKRKTSSLHGRYAVAAAALLLCAGPGAIATAAAQANPDVTKIKKAFMISPDTALAWNAFKSQGGPTYAGSPSGVRFANFLLTTAQELGLVDIDFVDIPYTRYVVDDWPDVRTHQF